MENKFRLCTKTLFLTYPKENNVTKETIIHELRKNLEKNEVKWIVVGEERGDEDDNYEHFHCILELGKKINLKDPNRLDINGVHGNYQSSRNKKAAIKYATKEGNYLSDGINTENQIYKSLKKPFDRFIYKVRYMEQDPEEILRKCIGRGEVYNQDEFEIGVDYLSSPAKYERVVARYKPHRNIQRDSLFVHEELLRRILNWYSDKHPKTNIRKSLYIAGGPGVGKTTLAIQLTQNKGMLVRHKDHTKKFIPEEYTAVIFDDMNFSHYPRESCINILDTETDLQFDVKGSMTLIAKECHRIFTSNKVPEEVFNEYDGAMKRRLILINIDQIEEVTQSKTIYFNEKDIPKKLKKQFHDLQYKTIEFIIAEKMRREVAQPQEHPNEFDKLIELELPFPL